MTTKILPRDSYYLDNGKFYPRSKWSKWLRMGAVISILVLGSFMPASANFYHHDIKSMGASYTTKEPALLDHVLKTNKTLTKNEGLAIVSALTKWANEFKIDVSLLAAVATVESRFDRFAISSAGAFGVMQVIPSWHVKKIVAAKEELGSPELFNVNTNTYIGAWVLRDCINQFKSMSKGLLCYNGSLSNPNGYDDKVLSAKQGIDRLLKNT